MLITSLTVWLDSLDFDPSCLQVALAGFQESLKPMASTSSRTLNAQVCLRVQGLLISKLEGCLWIDEPRKAQPLV